MMRFAAGSKSLVVFNSLQGFQKALVVGRSRYTHLRVRRKNPWDWSDVSLMFDHQLFLFFDAFFSQKPLEVHLLELRNKRRIPWVECHDFIFGRESLPKIS